MASCCFLPRTPCPEQLGHAFESNLSEPDTVVVARRSGFSKLAYFDAGQEDFSKFAFSFWSLSKVTIDSGPASEFCRDVLDSSSDRMSNKRDSVNISGEAGSLSSESVMSGKEEESDSSSDNSEARETPITPKGVEEIDELKYPGVSRKRARMDDAHFRMLDTAIDITKNLNTFKQVDATCGDTSARLADPLRLLSGHNNDLSYDSADRSTMNSNHTAPFLLVPAVQQELRGRSVSHEMRDSIERNLKGGDLFMEKTDRFSMGNSETMKASNAFTPRTNVSSNVHFTGSVTLSREIEKRLRSQTEDCMEKTDRFSMENSETMKAANALTPRTNVSSNVHFTGSVTPSREIKKRLRSQSEDLATPRSSISLSSQDGDANFSVKSSKGSKEIISECYGRGKTGFFDWNLLHGVLGNAPHTQLNSTPGFYPQGYFRNSQESMKSSIYPGMPGALPPLQFSNKYPKDDSQMTKFGFESSHMQLGLNLQGKGISPCLLQKNPPESFVKMLNSSCQLQTLIPPSVSAHPAEGYGSGLQFVKSHEYQQCLQRSILQSNHHLANSITTQWLPTEMAGHAFQSSAASLPVSPHQSNMPLPAHSHTQYPLSSLHRPVAISNRVFQDGCGKSRVLSEGFESMGLLLQKPFSLEASPSVTVVMEGSSIGRSLCLHNYHSYDSFANALREMFESDFSERDLSMCHDKCNLENAIPGHIVAYEDAENDLLLAGDLSWRDFVCAAKRIRILPSKASKNKGES